MSETDTSDPKPQDRDSSPRFEGWACLAAAMVAIGLGALLLPGSRDFALDDAWIHLSYAKSLRLGDGLSYNPGDWETGFSSPLWVVLLAAWPIEGDPVLPVKLLGVLLHGASAYLGAALALDLGRGRADVQRPVPLMSIGLLAGALVASNPTLLQGATSGMEVPLSCALLLGLARAILTGPPWAALCLGALAVLARPEALGFAVALGAIVGGWRWHRRRPRRDVAAALLGPLGALLAVAAWVSYCFAVSGYPWPNTQYVKGTGGGLAGLSYLTAQVLPWQPWLVGLTGVVLLGLVLRRDLLDRRVEAPAVLVAWLATMVAIAVSRPLSDAVSLYQSRYFAPLAAIPAAVLPLGLVGLRRVVAFALVLPVAVLTGLQVAEVHDVTRALEDDTRAVHTQVARYIAAELPRDAVLAVEGAGAIRFFAPRSMSILDLLGLNDREAAHLTDPQRRLCAVARRRPQYFVLPAHWVANFSKAYALTPVAEFADPHYTQVDPPIAHAVVVLAADGLRPHWRAWCDSQDQPSGL